MKADLIYNGHFHTMQHFNNFIYFVFMSMSVLCVCVQYMCSACNGQKRAMDLLVLQEQL